MRSTFLRMALTAAVLSSGLSLAASASAHEWQDLKWTQCAYDTQCEVVEGICGEPMGINNAYRNDVQDWLSAYQPKNQCSADRPHPALNEMSAFCMSGTCTVKPDKSYAVIHHQ